jgi:hypothetical protein
MQLSCICGKFAEPSEGSGGYVGKSTSIREEKMRKTISVAALIMALTGSAHAGDMPNGSPEPPPRFVNVVEEPTIAATTEDGTQGTSQGGVMQSALDLLALLPSLF